MTAPAAAQTQLQAQRQDDGTLLVRLSGDWLLGGSIPPDAVVLQELDRGAAKLAFDSAELAAWDSALLAMVLRLSAESQQRGVAFDVAGLPAGLQRLIALAEAVPEKSDAKAEEEAIPVIASIGLSMMSVAESAGTTITFLGDVTISVGRFIRGKARYQRSELGLMIQQSGVDAVSIVCLVSFLLGLILAFVSAIQLQQFGAAIFVADLVGIAMVRDMGALITAIVMAGRSGAAYAAQLGTMKVNEEIDALTTMGIDPLEFLVTPRIVSLVLMMPLLTLFADAVGIFGGMLVGVSMLDLSFTAYFQQTVGAISLTHLFGGLFKGAVYGALIGVAGCLRGMQSGRSAGAVGDAATSAVVTAIVWIIAAAGVFSFVFYLLGW